MSAVICDRPAAMDGLETDTKTRGRAGGERGEAETVCTCAEEG